MSLDSKSRAKKIFIQAIEIESPKERSAFLKDACSGDAELCRRVQALILAHESPESLLDKAAPELSADGMARTVGTQETEKPGTKIGHYKLLQQIGEGGMGTVFMAEQTDPVNRRVAVKIIKPGMDSKSVIARFEAERQALAMMDHPNIATVLDAGTTELGRPYFAMELVKGIPITDFCDKNKLTVSERVDLFSQVCMAIHHAHQKGIIHRDIKPTNVLVTLHDGKPVPKVIDFGVAKALSGKLTEKTLFTAHFQVVGTLLYMSPEQAELSGLDIDTRSDIYSLGVLLYELLTGTTPLQHDELCRAGFDEQRRVIREKEPPRASVRISSLGDKATAVAASRSTDARRLNSLISGDLDWILCKAVEKNRTRRYDSANQFAEDCQNFLNNELVLARAPTLGYRLSRWLYRQRVAILMAVIVLGSLSAALVVTYKENKELQRTQQELRSLLFEDVVMQIMRLDRANALEVIGQRTAAMKLSEKEVDLLLGIWEFYSGSVSKSRRYFENSLAERPDWIIPKAILSVANTFEGRPDENEHYLELNRLVELKGEANLTALEKLFVGHARIYPDTDLGRLTLQEINNLALPLADAIIADSYVHEASESDDTTRLMDALRHSENAIAYLEKNPYSLMVRLWAINHALLMDGDELPDREELIEEGEDLIRKMSDLPARTNILANVVLFYLETGPPEKALAAARIENARMPDWTGEAWEVLPLLSINGDREAALEVYDGSDAKSGWDLFFQGVLNYDDESKVKEAFLSYDWSNSRRKFVAPDLLLLLIDDDSFRSKQAGMVIKSLGDSKTPWDESLSQFIAGIQPYGEYLIEAAKEDEDHKRMNLSRAYLALGLQAIRLEDVEEAKMQLQKCREVRRPFECFFATAILKMLEKLHKH